MHIIVPVNIGSTKSLAKADVFHSTVARHTLLLLVRFHAACASCRLDPPTDDAIL